jgi:hypothetical protein
MAYPNPFSSIYSKVGYNQPGRGFSQPITFASPTTEDFDMSMPDILSKDLGLSSSAFQSTDARNTAQKSMAQSNAMVGQKDDLGNKDYFGQALSAITSLNKRFGFDVGGGQPIPIAGGRGLMLNRGLRGVPYQTFRATPSEYNTIEGKTLTGSEIPKQTMSFGISQEMKNSQAALPRLDVPATGITQTEDNNPNTTMLGLYRNL